MLACLAAVLPSIVHARLFTDPFTTSHIDVPNHGSKLLEEGMDMACLAQQCLVDSGCMKALLGVQMCKEDPFCLS